MEIRPKNVLFLGLILILALALGTSAAAAQSSSSSVSDVIGPAEFLVYGIDLSAGADVTMTVVCDEVTPGSGNRPVDPAFEVEFEDATFIGGDDDSYSTANGGVDCNAFASSIFSFIAPATGQYLIFVYNLNGSEGGPFTLTATLNNGGTIGIAPVGTAFTDGRINEQTGAPFVLYCDGTTTHVYNITGTEVGVVEDGESGSAAGWTLAPTADGRMLFTSAFPDTKPYYFIYDGCPHGGAEALSGDPAIQFDSTTY